jgi:ribonuclease E
MLQLVEVDRYDGAAAVGKLDGLEIVVADAASQVGKRVKVRVERVLDGRAYAVAIRKTKAAPEPLTAEGEAEKPTRKPPARKGATAAKESEPAEEEPAVEAEEPDAETESKDTPEAEEASPQAPAAKKKTRRGSRGGRKRKKPPVAAGAVEAGGASAEAPESSRGVTIHIPGDDLGRGGKAEPVEKTPAEPEPQATEEPPTAEAAQETAVSAEPGRGSSASTTTLAAEAEAPKPKKKTRRGSRGGKNRKKKPAAAPQNGAEAAADAEQATEPEPESAAENGDFDYVPMSEWADELEPKG